MLLWSLLFLCYSLLFVCTEGCRRSSDSSNKITVKVNNETIPENHRLFCTKNETRSLACLNGGSCFAVYIEDRTVQCACVNKYTGSRCEMIDPEIIFEQYETSQRKVKIACISGFGGLGYLLLIVVLAIIYKKCTKESGNFQNSDPSARPLTMDNDKTKNTDRDEIRKTTL
ncbi:Hypothetical predicted protein [Mytilus galloprovincialis]|uniref:EGF-like domain-containing protein n=1 Tax=Mytilus galloprovincialis TaxID=29158 RepID=A0A8B6H923_MYTGA|nr:Hypothetical predicted protein [Mytilus galloprovincialis]